MRRDLLLRDLAGLDVDIAKLDRRLVVVERQRRRRSLRRLLFGAERRPTGPTMTAADGTTLERRNG